MHRIQRDTNSRIRWDEMTGDRSAGADRSTRQTKSYWWFASEDLIQTSAEVWNMQQLLEYSASGLEGSSGEVARNRMSRSFSCFPKLNAN